MRCREQLADEMQNDAVFKTTENDKTDQRKTQYIFNEKIL